MTRIVAFPAIRVSQPIGDFFVGAIKFQDLIDISKADMRRIEEGTDRFVGIQRKISGDRVRDIARFVDSIDATFPTSIVLSVDETCATYDEGRQVLTLSAYGTGDPDDEIKFDAIANILDGQHRIEGLRQFDRTRTFELPVSVFISPDPSDEAYVFATVNLAQTKVNASLVYDLLDFAKARSPQKSCHDVAVALDRFEKSPLFGMIKRLGTATPGRHGETLAQATVVTSLLALISVDPEGDRYALAKGKRVDRETYSYQKTPLRPLWLAKRDSDIAQTLTNYFAAVRDKWPFAWGTRETGFILNRTNGFRGCMRFLRDVFVYLRRDVASATGLIRASEFRKIFDRVSIKESEFTTDRYAPGTSGETRLYKDLREQSKV